MPRELDVAIDLARRAGDAILKVRSGEFVVEDKGAGEGPVTIADRQADALIRAGLEAAFPSDALLSEEHPDDLARLGQDRVWIVDPLDGTRQFVQRGTEFAVLIGLAVAGRATVGVVHLPCDEVTYAAADGIGAFEIDAAGRRRRITLAPAPPHADELTVVVSREHYSRRTRRAVDLLRPTQLIASGSVGRKAALIAAGHADVYVTMGGRSRHWDACASEVVVREAGGAFRDARGGELVYNTEMTHNACGLLACRAALLNRTVAAVEAALAEFS